MEKLNTAIGAVVILEETRCWIENEDGTVTIGIMKVRDLTEDEINELV